MTHFGRDFAGFNQPRLQYRNRHPTPPLFDPAKLAAGRGCPSIGSAISNLIPTWMFRNSPTMRGRSRFSMDAEVRKQVDHHLRRLRPIQAANRFGQTGIAEFEKRCFDEIELAVAG